MHKFFLLLFLLFLFYHCSDSSLTHNELVQVSTIDAILAGVYDGEITCEQLLTHGNQGIGTFDRLDGEMIVMDGEIFQVKADGKVYRPDLTTRTPFASVVNFLPEQKVLLDKPLTFAKAEVYLDSLLGDLNGFYAFRLNGSFSYMKTRSVPAQQKPYPPLSAVAENQPEFELFETQGTIIGFYCPPFIKGLNVPGYHWHYLNDAFTNGGHILDFKMIQATVEIDRIYNYSLILPRNNNDFKSLDLSIDRSQELERVEK